jgi:hypothetical protein
MAACAEWRHIDFMSTLRPSALIIAALFAVLLGQIMHVELNVPRETIRLDALVGAAFLCAACAAGYLANRWK